MLALGCIFPVAFFIGGALLGAALGGNSGSIWGAIAGLVLGLAVPAVMFRALIAARKKR
ncbi:hypothetical protein GCM10023219_04160 [Stakelama sediminis]|uniref:Membrane associated rhomboid family serine protease n=1 Tax=Stakelama sediminis TaxID=463200 RepID=A0A840YU82_9SPHN|nr:hypothetical protein [Stakelama sediminis]MBB5717130.1 membrane associated rhomboid family serine protease [Stakelama sediminis]